MQRPPAPSNPHFLLRSQGRERSALNTSSVLWMRVNARFRPTSGVLGRQTVQPTQDREQSMGRGLHLVAPPSMTGESAPPPRRSQGCGRADQSPQPSSLAGTAGLLVGNPIGQYPRPHQERKSSFAPGGSAMQGGSCGAHKHTVGSLWNSSVQQITGGAVSRREEAL